MFWHGEEGQRAAPLCAARAGAGSEGLAADRLQALEGGSLVRARLLLAADFVRLRDLHPEDGVEYGLAGMLNGVLALLMVPVVDDVGTGLVESDMKMMTAMYAAGWTGHSERATVASVLAAAGYSQEDRAYLGRWAAGSSEEYVRTYIVHGGHKKVDRRFHPRLDDT